MQSKFPDRLKKLREEKNLTQEQLGKLINSTDVTISRYEKGLREPDLDTLEQLANIFDVSVDYLLGLTNMKRPSSSQVSEDVLNYGEIIAPFPSSGNPLDELPEEAIKELRHYTEFLYNKWKGWKPGDPPR